MTDCSHEQKYKPGQLIVPQRWESAIIGFKALTQTGAGVLHNSGVIHYHVLRPDEIMLVLEHTEVLVVPEAHWVKSCWVHVLLGDEKYFIPGYQTSPI
jgi:hypothetical protein